MPETRPGAVDRLLTVAEVADVLGTTERFPRRLIAERRIAFIHVGRTFEYQNQPCATSSRPGWWSQ